MALKVVQHRKAQVASSALAAKEAMEPNERTRHWGNVDRQCANELGLIKRAIERLIEKECSTGSSDTRVSDRPPDEVSTSSRGGACCIPGHRHATP
jgi:hypothetical protein